MTKSKHESRPRQSCFSKIFNSSDTHDTLSRTYILSLSSLVSEHTLTHCNPTDFSNRFGAGVLWIKELPRRKARCLLKNGLPFVNHKWLCRIPSECVRIRLCVYIKTPNSVDVPTADRTRFYTALPKIWEKPKLMCAWTFWIGREVEMRCWIHFLYLSHTYTALSLSFSRKWKHVYNSDRP